MSLTNFTSPPSGRLAAVDGESHSSGRNNKNIKKVPLIVGAWNVRTLMDREEADRPMRRTALVAKELERYRIDIAALSKTRFPGEGQLKEVGSGYTFFWSGRSSEERRESGVGFAIKNSLAGKIEGS